MPPQCYLRESRKIAIIFDDPISEVIVFVTYKNMYPDIIPYNSWINSQLSVARHYGGMKIGDKDYVVDYIFAKEGKDGLCFPDLVEKNLHMKMQKERPEETKKYYDNIQKNA